MSNWALPGESWNRALANALVTDSWAQLKSFVDGRRAAGTTVYPPPDQVFRAFELTSFDAVRVVILGQDPYHGEGQAHGLAFSVADETNPLSLRRIFAALDSGSSTPRPQNRDLSGWARQGVLLLNTVLTVDAGRPNSHRGQGWEEFTSAVISAIDESSEPIVFVLLGRQAQRARKLIKRNADFVIEAAHPAARANAKNKLTSKVFSDINERINGPKIEWDTSAGEGAPLRAG